MLNEPLANIGRRLTTAAKTITGDAAEELAFDGDAHDRTGVWIKNYSATLYVYIKLYNAGESVPTVSSTDHDFQITPGNTLELIIRKSIKIAAINSSAAATTSTVSAVEFRA